MKILFISMPSIHAIRWIENLKDASHELYWFDILSRGKLATINSVVQFTDWQKRKLPYLKGEYFLSKKMPLLYEIINPYLEVSANKALEEIILKIKPDIIHSFEMQGCSYPIVKTMRKYPNIKWIYSCWGNDLYHYKQFPWHLKKIKQVLKQVNFMHADCQRDLDLASSLGFCGKHLGVIPTGAGYHLENIKNLKLSTKERNVILVKGYEHHFGRGLNIVKALSNIKDELKDFDIIVFGAHKRIIDYVNSNNLNFKVYNRNELAHQEILALMGKSIIYIGNSISDGMPNTLLEAIIMGAFPIQSNPGGATAEIIENGRNGFLINDAESISEIEKLITSSIGNKNLMANAILINEKVAAERLDYNKIKPKIVALYNTLE